MTLGRGWTGGQNFRPAREVDVIYGHGLVKSESADWPRYVAVPHLRHGKLHSRT